MPYIRNHHHRKWEISVGFKGKVVFKTHVVIKTDYSYRSAGKEGMLKFEGREGAVRWKSEKGVGWQEKGRRRGRFNTGKVVEQSVLKTNSRMTAYPKGEILRKSPRFTLKKEKTVLDRHLPKIFYRRLMNYINPFLLIKPIISLVCDKFPFPLWNRISLKIYILEEKRIIIPKGFLFKLKLCFETSLALTLDSC